MKSLHLVLNHFTYISLKLQTMNKLKNVVLTIAYVALLNLAPAFSQKKADMITTKWADKPVLADGQLNDWRDSLTLYNEATRLYYSLANDEKNIYLALRSNSKEDLTKILTGGISFAANINSKKKDPATVIFPVLDRTPGKSRNVKEQPEREEMQKKVLSRIKDIKVSGFKEIIDGGISLQNTYGIRASAAFDKNNNLVQEIIIPLSLLNLSPSSTELVTYNIKINGLQTPSLGMSQRQGNQRQPIGGINGGQFPQRNTQYNKLLATTEFYIKSRLAAKR